MTSVEDVVKILRDFDVTKAHCYNPNEESRLMTVITAVGVDKFNESIRDVATIYANRRTRSKRRQTGQNVRPELNRDRSAANFSGKLSDKFMLFRSRSDRNSSNWGSNRSSGASRARAASAASKRNAEGAGILDSSEGLPDSLMKSPSNKVRPLQSISSRSIGRAGSDASGAPGGSTGKMTGAMPQPGK